MQSPEQILSGLQLIANRALTVATVWHIAIFMAALGLLAGWRPSRRLFTVTVALTVLSVAVVMWLHLQLWLGVVFSALAVVLGILALRTPAARTGRLPRWVLVLGIAMTALGLVYPRFLETGSFFWYLYAAPLGVLPCPTLAFAIGVTLLIDNVGPGSGARVWALLVAAVGLFFGVVAVAKLGVWLDLGLVVGATGLAARAIAFRRAA